MCLSYYLFVLITSSLPCQCQPVAATLYIQHVSHPISWEDRNTLFVGSTRYSYRRLMISNQTMSPPGALVCCPGTTDVAPVEININHISSSAPRFSCTKSACLREWSCNRVLTHLRRQDPAARRSVRLPSSGRARPKWPGPPQPSPPPPSPPPPEPQTACGSHGGQRSLVQDPPA